MRYISGMGARGHGEMVKAEIGKSIKAARLSRGLSGSLCGRTSGIGLSNWLRCELGYHLPSSLTLCRMARTLGVTMDSLMPDIGQVRAGLGRGNPNGFNDRPTRKESNTLRAIAALIPDLWAGAEFSIDLLPVKLHKRTLNLEASKRLIYIGQGRYRISGRLRIKPSPDIVLPRE